MNSFGGKLARPALTIKPIGVFCCLFADEKNNYYETIMLTAENRLSVCVCVCVCVCVYVCVGK